MIHICMEYNTNLQKHLCINSLKKGKLKEGGGGGGGVEAGGWDRSCMEWEMLKNTLIC